MVFLNRLEKFFLDNQSITDMFFRNMRNLLIVNQLRQPPAMCGLNIISFIGYLHRNELIINRLRT